MFKRHKQFKEKGVLGMNARNAAYVMKYNQRKFYPNADSKLKTKSIANDYGIPAPELYHVFSRISELKKIESTLALFQTFVIKPEHGSGGEGIMVLTRNKEGQLCDPDMQPVSTAELKMFVSDILSGLYSLGGQPDSAMVEYKIDFDPVFSQVAYRGVPDIRVIVLQNIPVMAMLRLPTSNSGGKANLHQGAIGVGVSINSGLTRGGVQENKIIEIHPDTGNPVQGVQVPHWDKIIEIAASGSEMFKLGYLGMDFVLDKTRGPMLLEVNVRPGLAIQLANRIPLRKRLEACEKKASLLNTVEKRVAFAKNLSLS